MKKQSSGSKQACCASHTRAALVRRPLTAPNAAPANAVRIDHRNRSSSKIHRQAEAGLSKRLSCPDLFVQLVLWIPARAQVRRQRAQVRRQRAQVRRQRAQELHNQCVNSTGNQQRTSEWGRQLVAEQWQRENQRMSMRDLEVLSSIDPITTTSTGDSE